MAESDLSADDIKERLNDVDVKIAKSAREELAELDRVDDALIYIQKAYSNKLIVTKDDVAEVKSHLESGGEVTQPSSTDGTQESENTDGDNESEEDEVDVDDTLGEGFRPRIRNHSVTRVTDHTAESTEDFDEYNPNLDDPFEAIDTSERDGVERDTSNREILIDKDITGQSKTEGEIDDFAKYFRSRYEKLSNLLKRRLSPRPINALGQGNQREDKVSIVGMVYKKYTTRSNNQMLMVEDTTGTIRVVFTDEEQKETCLRVLEDEVVGIEGTLSDDGEIIFGDRLYFPDVSPRRTKRTADRDVKVAMVSDIHFGARECAVDKWNAFVDWIHQQPDIEYLMVAGDIIEGVGIYGGQQEELAVPNLDRQYDLCAHAFDQLPDDIDIIITPGNHDGGVRLAEPQPTFPIDVQDKFGDNVHFGGNPALITIEGVKFLVYHGVSLNPIIDALPDGDIQKPASAMWPLLQKRHLAPLYGEGVRIAPEHEDYLAIEEVPDVFHTGHVHTFDVDEYNNVKLINTGTFQHQTKYQIDLDVQPDVGYCSVVNLGDLNTEVFYF